jgi:Tfp pilus assembly PilM family ATPase
MHALAQWWHRRVRSSVRHAWGLAPLEGAWVLVGLTRQSATLVKVHTLTTCLPPMAPGMADDMADLGVLSQHLREYKRSRGGSHHRLNMALPSAFVREGFLDFPVDLPEENWLYEVQLEVAQACQVELDEVNFDFEPAPTTDGLVQRVHWVGCSQTLMTSFKNCTRAAGWRLAAVELEGQAAQRGVRALQGGSVSLLTQAPQDWQFRLDTLGGSSTTDDRTPASEESEETIQEALAQIMHTPGGARLVAAGLALKAWQ